MSFIDFLLGRPLASYEDRGEKIGAVAGIPIFGLDALGSAAYGPEAALTILIPLGVMGVHYILPISICIIVLLAIVYFSYRQTIDAYPSGGGSYTVASQNLGRRVGLLAAAALMIDYILVVAVGISAGVGAFVSAVPSLGSRTLLLCLGILILMTIVNLRGVRETGGIFMAPTFLFVGCMFATLALGAIKTIVAGGHPLPVVTPPKLPSAAEAVSLWILLKAFSSGCTAMTGVEAVSNGVRAFRDPTSQNARRSLTAIIAILMILLAGIAWLVEAYGITATNPGSSKYQSLLSMLIAAIAGTGVFYYVTIASILLVLAFSANTAFADFPRLCRAISEDGYLPYSFSQRGRRLVYSEGILVLAVLAGGLLIFFGGVTDRLIPLFAVGAFLAFTLSQAGMVAHWRRARGRGARHSMIINGIGATATGITVLIILVAKFVEGAWITILLIPGILMLMASVKRHYRRVDRETDSPSPVDLKNLDPPIVVVPILRWGKVTKNALRFALTVSPEVKAVHIASEEDQDDFSNRWKEYVEKPARDADLPPPELVVVSSPFRYVVAPILDYVLELEAKNANRKIAVVIPELVQRHWYHYFLHNQRAEVLKALLLVKGNQRIVVMNVPWYL